MIRAADGDVTPPAARRVPPHDTELSPEGDVFSPTARTTSGRCQATHEEVNRIRKLHIGLPGFATSEELLLHQRARQLAPGDRQQLGDRGTRPFEAAPHPPHLADRTAGIARLLAFIPCKIFRVLGAVRLGLVLGRLAHAEQLANLRQPLAPLIGAEKTKV